MVRKIQFILVLGLISSCHAPEKFSVMNVQDITGFQENSVIYALPRSVISIEVTAVQTTTIPGPYYEYAQKYLGIKDVPREKSVKWEINSMYINSYNEIDPDYFYSVKDAGNIRLKEQMTQLNDAGLILYPGIGKGILRFSEFSNKGDNEIYFTDLSVKRNITQTKDTAYKQIFKDSTYVRIPYLKKEIAKKTLDEKAAEAANFLIKLRKRRFKLLSGQYEHMMPDGESAEISVREMNSLEEEYLSLFIGKTIEEEYLKTYLLTPESGKDLSRIILFKFDDNSGFREANDVRGKTVIAEISDLGNTKHLERLVYPYSGSAADNTLFYRVPDKANIKILYGSYTLAEALMNIYQFGTIVPVTIK
ncbi:MAG: DUF4831 family protein [Bacteroidales bacterium]|nr:DUF4831 family protein [Bacteroidales bacterium]